MVLFHRRKPNIIPYQFLHRYIQNCTQCCTVQYSYVTYCKVNNHSHPFIMRKNQLSLIFAKILPRPHPQRFLRYIFLFPRYTVVNTLVLRFFVTSAYFYILNYTTFTVLKELNLRNLSLFEIFPYLTPLKSYLKNKYSFLNSAHSILDFFAHVVTILHK